jgi:hypothetical protein
MNTTYYLSGPMSGIAGFNVAAFEAAAVNLRASGLTIISPIEINGPANQKMLAASVDGRAGIHATSWGANISRSVRIISDSCAGLILLPNWTLSKGAKIEAHLAILAGKKVGMYLSVTPFVKWESVDAIVAGLKGSLK